MSAVVPKITYLSRLHQDMVKLANWVYGDRSPNVGVGEYNAICWIRDIIQVTVQHDDANDEWVYYEKDVADTLASLCPNFAVKWRTSSSSNGAGAKVELEFDDASTEVIFGSTPQFSTTWKVSYGTITNTAKTIDKIRLYADDYPNSVDWGSSQALYDWIIFYKNIFTFPDWKLLFPKLEQKIARIEIPDRDGDIIDKLGLKSIDLTLQGTMRKGETWGGAIEPWGEFMLYVMRSRAPWEWFTCSMGNVQVVPTYFGPKQDASQLDKIVWELLMLTHKESSYGEAEWDDLVWLGKGLVES